MKEGAGEDPFADDGAPEDGGSSAGAETGESEASATATDTEADDGNDGRPQPMNIPYKFRRDGVQDGRERVPLFLKPETKDAEREALRELEDRFGDDVALTDVREALVKAGLEHIDEAEAHLEEWGYGMTFED